MKNSTKERLKRFIKISEEIITIDSLEEVIHYYDHGEYEMAFEGLVIELINANRYPDNFIFYEWMELALEFNLDKESIFDGEFWRKFILWGEAHK